MDMCVVVVTQLLVVVPMYGGGISHLLSFFSINFYSKYKLFFIHMSVNEISFTNVILFLMELLPTNAGTIASKSFIGE